MNVAPAVGSREKCANFYVSTELFHLYYLTVLDSVVNSVCHCYFFNNKTSQKRDVCVGT